MRKTNDAMQKLLAREALGKRIAGLGARVRSSTAEDSEAGEK